jgi:hypothetical protein
VEKEKGEIYQTGGYNYVSSSEVISLQTKVFKVNPPGSWDHEVTVVWQLFKGPAVDEIQQLADIPGHRRQVSITTIIYL